MLADDTEIRQSGPELAPTNVIPTDTDHVLQPGMLIHSSAKRPSVGPFRALSIFTAAFVSGCLPFGIFMMVILKDPDDSEEGLYAFMYGLVCVSLLLILLTSIVAMVIAYPVIRNGLAKAVFISSLLVSLLMIAFAGAIVMDVAMRSGDYLLAALTLTVNPLYVLILTALILSTVFSFKLKSMY